MLTALLTLMFAASAAAGLIARALGRNAGYVLAAVFTIAAGMMLTMAPEVISGATVVEIHSWVPTLGFEFVLRLNGLALLFASLVLGVGALVLSYAPQYLDAHYDHGRLYSILTLFATAMLGLVLAGDLIVLVVFWEITTLCSFLLIGGRGTAGSRPATRALFVTAGGGLALLAAVVLLIVRTGTSSISEIIASAPDSLSSTDVTAVGVLVVLAAFTKSAQMPFHFWLPDAMVAITPVSAYLHAATLVKAGIFLLLLFSPLFTDYPGWHLTLMAVGLATAVFGAFEALRQNDLKALLAYSTVSQLGLMVALVGVGTSAALAAATLLVVAHALFKATLFMLVGIIDREAGSRDIRELSGLWRVMPVTAALTGLAAMSMAGVPPLVGFVAKEEAFYAFLSTSNASWTSGGAWSGYLAAAVAVLGAGLTFAYSARIIAGAFAGPLKQTSLYEPAAAFLAPAAIPAVLGLVLGLVPFLLNPIVNRAVVDAGFSEQPADLALWHGFTVALALSATAITIGVLVHTRRPQLTRVFGSEPRTPISPALFDTAWDATLQFGAMTGRAAHRTRVGTHLAGVVLLLGILAAFAIGLEADLDPIQAGTSRWEDVAVLVILAAAMVVLVRASNALVALVLAGLIGFAIAIWLLLLGAPDVALTLLLVEILTVVVAAPILAGLPRPTASKPGRMTALAAVFAGLITGAFVWLFTGRRDPSDASRFFLSEAEPATGGSNVVNTILVDFRGLDTLGEIVVLAAAAFGLFAALAGGWRRIVPPPTAGRLGSGETAILRVGAVVVLPLLIISAAILFWRGHDEPGGGFISGLVAGAAVAVARFAGIEWRLPSAQLLAGGGLLIALGTGLAGLVFADAFLQPMKIPAPGGSYVTSSLIFDLGVFLVVIGLVRAALDHLGDSPTSDESGDTAGASPAAGSDAGEVAR